MKNALCMCAVLAAVALAAPSDTRAQDAASYDALVREGLSLSASGNWPEAYAAFKRAYEVKPGPRPLRGMAIVLFELRRYVESIDAADRALASTDTERPLSAAMRDELTALREKALTYVVRTRIEVAPVDATVTIDGTPRTEQELMLDEGDYTVEVTHEGYAPRTLTLRARIGTAPQLKVVLEKLRDPTAPVPATLSPSFTPAAEPSHLASWTLLGVGGAALIAGSITAIAASSTFADLDDRCPGPSCTPELRDDTDTGRTLETLTNVLFIAGGTFVAAGIFTRFVLETPEAPDAVGVAFAPSCGTDGCSVAIKGRL